MLALRDDTPRHWQLLGRSLADVAEPGTAGFPLGRVCTKEEQEQKRGRLW